MNNNKIVAETKSRHTARPRLVTRGTGVTRTPVSPASMTQILFFPLCRSRERWGARWLGSEWVKWGSNPQNVDSSRRDGSDTLARTLGYRSQTACSYSPAQIRDWITEIFRWKLRMIGVRVARPRTGGVWTCGNWKEAEVTCPMKKVDRVKHRLTELRNR